MNNNTEQLQKLEESFEALKTLIKLNTIDYTPNFILHYLTPVETYKYEYYKDFTHENSRADRNLITEYIRNMPYQDFLKTPYWRMVSRQVKIRAQYKCQLCSSKLNLASHHRDYKCHGQEVYRIHELICLCEECHSKFHNK